MPAVDLRLFEPLGAVHCILSDDTRGADILDGVAEALGLASDDAELLRLTTRGGRPVGEDEALPSTELEVRVRCLGGKGGFGNQLRAQGGRMSARSNGNTDSCRDLNGRRLSTIKEAKRLAEYMAKEPERQKALDDAQTRKYAKLEKMLGRKPKSTEDFEEAAQKLDDAGDALEGQPEAGPSTEAGPPKRKERIEDHEYVEQSREIVDNVRSAVAMAMKKRKMKKAPAKPVAAKTA